MAKPAITKKPSKKKPSPQPIIVVTGKNAFGWMLSLFVVCGCMFVIGVLVGRGQAPVQFDTQEWEQDLKNLKISVLAKQKELQGAIEHIEVLDFLKEKGKSIQFYKQYIPPLLSPKYGKNPPATKILPVAGEPSLPEEAGGQSVAALTPKMSAAPANHASPAETTTTAISPKMEMVSGKDSAIAPPESPETRGTEATAETAGGQPPVYETTGTDPGQTQYPDTIQEDPEKPTPATDAMMTVKTPATTKPGPTKTSSAPAADKARAPARTQTFPEQKPDTAVSPDVVAAAPESTDPAAPSLQYAIQVASLRELDKANTVRDKFRTRGYPAYCQRSEVRGMIWHRVRIGPYPDRHTADLDCMRLKEVGVDALVFVLER